MKKTILWELPDVRRTRFSATGQLWGNPLYDWEYHKKTGYEWWIRRIAYCLKLYDVVRIDHFRGFDEYYSIPYGEETAVNGKWMPGPGMDLFRAIEKKLGRPEIIAPDIAACEFDSFGHDLLVGKSFELFALGDIVEVTVVFYGRDVYGQGKAAAKGR